VEAHPGQGIGWGKGPQWTVQTGHKRSCGGTFWRMEEVLWKRNDGRPAKYRQWSVQRIRRSAWRQQRLKWIPSKNELKRLIQESTSVMLFPVVTVICHGWNL
jgi:hypothetical protein